MIVLCCLTHVGSSESCFRFLGVLCIWIVVLGWLVNGNTASVLIDSGDPAVELCVSRLRIKKQASI